MSNDKTPNPHRSFGPLVIFPLAFALRLLIAWTGVETLVQKTLADDGYYYFVIARHVAQGLGPTVDGVTLTNGFHPLWALLIVPIFAAWPAPPDLPIHLSLSLAALLDTATAWLGYRTVRMVTGSRKAALVSGLFYALNPMTIMESGNGLETALSTCLMALCFLWWVRIGRRKGNPRMAHAVLGLLAGLMVLARTDSIFLFGLMLLVMGGHVKREGVASLLTTALVFAVTLLPWLAWNQLTFGTVIQSSGVALPYVSHYFVRQALAQGAPLTTVLNHFVWPVINLSFHLLWQYSGLGWTALIVLWGTLRFFRPRLAKAHRPDILAVWRPFALAVLAAALVLGFHTFYRLYPRSWYYVPMTWAVSLLVGPTLARVSAALRPITRWGRATEGLVVGGLLLVFALQGMKTWRAGFYPWQIDMYRAAQWVAENTAPSDVIGAFNAGLQAYHSGRTVVSLDGVTNPDAFRAIREKRLLAYARQRGIRYIVDYEAYIRNTYGPFMGPGYPEQLKLAETLSPPHPAYGPVVVYALSPAP